MHYEANNQGYFLMDEDQVLMGPFEELAVAYAAPEDASMMWTLYKHGDPSIVEAWCESTKSRFMQAAKHGSLAKDMADELHVIRGHLNLEHLNAAIATSGGIKSLVEKALAIDLDEPSEHRSLVTIDGVPVGEISPKRLRLGRS